MDIVQIETFLAVGTFGGFRRAADALRVTQPAVSARIKTLEGALGDPSLRALAGRPRAVGGRPRPPTARGADPAGCGAGAAGGSRAPARQRRGAPDRGGAVDLRLPPSRRSPAVPGGAAARPRHRPLGPLEGGARDGAAGRGGARSGPLPPAPGRRDGEPRRRPPGPGAGPGPPLVSRRRARLEEIADRPLVFFDRGSSDWTLTHGLFRRAGLVPNVTLEVETIETAKRMVERGLGLAFLPHLAVAPDLRRGALTAIEIADAEPLRRSLDVVHPRHRLLSSDALAFLDALRTAVRDVEEGRRAGGRRRREAHAGRAGRPARRARPGGQRGARRGAPGSGRSRNRRP